MRRYRDWLEGYLDFARDGYAPDEFHRWVGLSVLAGALERKVWLSNRYVTFYPNLFVMLVTFPGVGKSTTIKRGVQFLERLKAELNPEFKIIPQQVTEPQFIEEMKIRQEMRVSPTRIVFHSSGYFYADEASSSALQNTHGSFTSTVTGFYDCPKVFRKATKLDGLTEFQNICFNLLAGTTFNYLNTLVNEESVMGGFASRNVYVVQKERLVREVTWTEGEEDEDPRVDHLFADLAQIHTLQGRMKPTPGFIRAWEAYQPELDRELIALNSPRLESLAARKGMTMTKIAMLLAVSENDSLVVTEDHWERARALVDRVATDYPFILSQGAIANTESQTGMNQIIGQTLKKSGGMLPLKVLKRIIVSSGNDLERVDTTLNFMAQAGLIEFDGVSSVRMLVDPDRYL